MEERKNPELDYSYFYILAVICGLLTAWIFNSSILYIISGAIAGWLLAAFYVNVLVKDREV